MNTFAENTGNPPETDKNRPDTPDTEMHVPFTAVRFLSFLISSVKRDAPGMQMIRLAGKEAIDKEFLSILFFTDLHF